jgi:nucleoside-triphosphatase THEP1
MDMIRDMIEVPHSLLFLGRPGVGKTTVIREMARVLSDDLHKRVVIVDTSNEIGGDGDVPHPAIGGARRMQVPDPSQQHRVMVEAVENHMPEVVIVDEIGTEAEALACRSIAERGVQLVGTAHGQLLENLIKNPTLSDLIGGICSVTLGDEEARARGTQKSILERKAPPTFPLVIEMRERACWVTHWVEDSVDCLLHGKDPVVQLRRRQPGVKDVVVEEQRYDSLAATGVSADSLAPPFETMAPARPEPAGLPAVDPAVAAVEEALLGIAPPDGPAFGATFNASDPDDPYAWAQRLKNIPDKDALQELAYASSRGGGHVVNGVPHSSGRRAAKFTFTQGTGGGGGKRNSTRRSAGDGNRRRS